MIFITNSEYAPMGFLVLIAFAFLLDAKSSEALGTFRFDVHHRYSDPVKDLLDVDGLPEMGTLDYYAAMAHRDHLFKARRLASTPSTTRLTFFGGNETYRLSALGFLHYALASVGTPALTFLVALDTGSDLFWLPCDCTDCVRSLNVSSGKNLDLNIYSPNASTTSHLLPCNSTLCGPRRGCLISRDACAYQTKYLSSNTSSTGILIDDVLRLASNDNQVEPIGAPITLGCGIVQTGDFLEGGAPNGLFGLGMDDISVPSILANKGITANSFAMCFGPDGLGRIEFGYKVSPDQKVTPFNLQQVHPTYNVTVTQITVGNTSTSSGLEFTAIFDSGTSFTYLNDPAYTIISESFDSQISEPRYRSKSIFDYCYKLGANQNSFFVPDINLTMKGGEDFTVKEPIILLRHEDGLIFCLALIKSGDINIIGQNFMTGYRIVFDREEMVLGWKEANCYGSTKNILPVGNKNATNAPSPSVFQPEDIPHNSSRISPASAVPPSTPPPPHQGNNAICLRSISGKIALVIFSLIYHITIYS